VGGSPGPPQKGVSLRKHRVRGNAGGSKADYWVRKRSGGKKCAGSCNILRVRSGRTIPIIWGKKEKRFAGGTQ